MMGWDNWDICDTCDIHFGIAKVQLQGVRFLVVTLVTFESGDIVCWRSTVSGS
jgi:hypothetical protein